MSTLTECIYDHSPPPITEMQSRDLTYTIDERTPKGIAGWTILYGMRENPTTYGITITDTWYTDMCDAIADYEDYYFKQMEDLVALFDSLSTTSRTKFQTLSVHMQIYDILADIDAEYTKTIYDIEPTIPSAVWAAYIS